MYSCPFFIPLYLNFPLSNKRLLRTNKAISYTILSCCTPKFSAVILKEIYENQSGELTVRSRISGVHDLQKTQIHALGWLIKNLRQKRHGGRLSIQVSLTTTVHPPTLNPSSDQSLFCHHNTDTLPSKQVTRNSLLTWFCSIRFRFSFICTFLSLVQYFIAN